MALLLLRGRRRGDSLPLLLREALPGKVSFDQEHLDAAARWIGRSADSASGLAHRAYDLRLGWVEPDAASTGAAIPTLLAVADIRHSAEARTSASAFGAALVEAQRPEGCFWSTGGRSEIGTTVDALFGLLALTRSGEEPQAEKAAIAAAEWLCQRQDDDGAWHRLGDRPEPEGRAIWALAMADAILGRAAFGDAAVAHLGWIERQRRSDGWIDWSERSSVEIRSVAATVEGLLEAGVVLDDRSAFEAGAGLLIGLERGYRLAGSGVRLRWRNHLAGAISPDWRGTRRTACVEGSARIALCAYRAAGLGAVDPSRRRRFGDEVLDPARSAQALGGVPVDLVGGVPASAPIWGGTAPLQLTTMAAKALVDALLERRDGGLPRERLG